MTHNFNDDIFLFFFLTGLHFFHLLLGLFLLSLLFWSCSLSSGIYCCVISKRIVTEKKESYNVMKGTSLHGAILYPMLRLVMCQISTLFPCSLPSTNQKTEKHREYTVPCNIPFAWFLMKGYNRQDRDFIR